MSLLVRVALFVAGLGVLALPGAAGRAAAAPSDLFFSEYVEGSSNNKALEIFNGTGAPVNLSGYSVAMYFNGSPTAGLTVSLTGTVASGDVFVLAHSSAGAPVLAQADQTAGGGWFNGDDAVTLVRGGAVVDSIGQVGVDPGTEWGSGLTSTADNTLRRKPTVEAGDANPGDPFDASAQWIGFAIDTFDGLGSHAIGGGPSNAAVVASCGSAVTVTQGFAASRGVTATDADGTVSDISVTGVSPSPAPGTIARTAFTPAAAPGGTASATVTVAANVPPGVYSVTVTATNSDSPTSQSGTCTMSVTVAAVLPIGTVQGTVPDSADGLTHASPFVGQTVAVRGVVYQKTLARSGTGAPLNGFFVQNTAATDDDDPLSSDGIFVFMGGFTSLVGGYTPQVGEEVVISGRVTEFFNLTQLTSASAVQVVRSGVVLDAEVPAFEAGPPDDLAAANRYWERREGMRSRVPADSLVVGGRTVFPSTLDAEVWVIRGDHPVARRSDPFARRVFRDPHPLDDRDPPLFDNGNGYRIVLGSLGVKGATGDGAALLAPARTFDTVANAPVGGVYFSFGKYQIQVGQQLQLTPGVDPSTNAPPAAFDRRSAYSTSTYNVENLYDFRDDPFDGCDFTGNAGCPGVSPPFDYVPASDAEYQARLGLIARQIVDDLHGPDMVMVQEAEDQDICAVVAAALACGATDDVDGRPDTLQELSLAIAAAGGPVYDAVYDRDGADDRGIVSAFLFRTDRVELVPARADDPVLGSSPRVSYRGAALPQNTDVSNPKALNAVLPADVDRSTGTDGGNVYTRAPQVGHFRVWSDGLGQGVSADLYLLSNHFSSGPDRRVGQRREQAAYAAAVYDALQAANPNQRVIVGGDLNVYPRPDDPIQPPSDQLGPLYGAGLTNLFDRLVAEVPSSAYSYVFAGQAQVLDHQFVSPSQRDELLQYRVAHVNADWPADSAGDGARGLSDHDPSVARFSFAPQSLPGVVTSSTNWALRDSLTTGPATGSFTYGTRPPALVPLSGDWDGDGVQTPGIFQGGVFKLRNSNSGGEPEVVFTFGDARGFPVAGDFDGDGLDDVAVFRAGTWQVRIGGSAATSSFTFGAGTWPSVVPMVGDWDGDGTDGIGYHCRDSVTCPAGTWNLRHTATAGPADAGVFVYNPGTSPYPVVGDWDADGDDTVGVKTGTTPATWLLKNQNEPGPPDTSVDFGAANDLSVTWARSPGGAPPGGL